MSASATGTRAVLRHAGFSAFKARQVLDLIRGQAIDDALAELGLCQRDAADSIEKLLRSAVANAEHNDDLPADELFVAACFADEGPTARRFRPRARGRAGRIRKRSCHITIVVDRYSLEEVESRRQADEGAGRVRRSASADRARRVAKSRPDADQGDAGTSESTSASGDADATAASESGSTNEAMHLMAKPGAAGDRPHGPESHAPLEDGSQPEGYPIKGNADSMLYHVPGSRFYDQTEAEVWFATAEAAEAAGFALPPSQAKAAADGDEGAEAAHLMATPEKHEGPHGLGSHEVAEDGSQPEGFPIKGNADSMLYHVPGSRFYDQTVAEVWFATAEAAEAAGFALPPSQATAKDED